jgi:rfaE bifunctional protein nucleotidyltransferase chain/domain
MSSQVFRSDNLTDESHRRSPSTMPSPSQRSDASVIFRPMTRTHPLADKIVPRGVELHERLAQLPRPLVFTNGVFDVLHRGHVTYLDSAARLGGSLLVAVNTDRSTRMLGKGDDRPLNQESDRALVLAALSSVSLVTFFDDPSPVDLVRETRPDVYVKGGDYDMEQLEETRIVRSWGGESIAIPFVDGYSTTRLIQRIRKQARPEAGAKAAFLDRDGVINVDRGYVHRWADFQFAPGAIGAIAQLKQAGYRVVVVTNQAGIARGLYQEADFDELTRRMRSTLTDAGADVDAVYHCPHHPGGVIDGLAIECSCRKPSPGMLLRAAADLSLDLSASIMIGDKPGDIQAGRRAGLRKAYAVHSDNAESSAQIEGADATFSSLAECVQQILAESEACSADLGPT